MYSPYAFSSELCFNLGRKTLECPHTNRHCPDVTRKYGKNVRINYGSQLLELERKIEDEISLVNTSPSPATEAPSKDLQDDERASERIPSSVTKVADISCEI